MPVTALPPGATKTRFGPHQQFYITGVDVDRTALAHITAEMHVSDEGSANVNASFISIPFGFSVGGELGITGFLVVPDDSPHSVVVGVNRRYDRDGSMGIYTYTFEGFLANHEVIYVYELEFSMNQEPIETHPNFEVFEPKFGPYNPLDRVWPRVPTSRQAQAAGLPGGGDAASSTVTNPLFGTTSFLSPGATFRKMYTDTSIAETDLDGIGTIRQPDGLDDFNKEFSEWVQNQSKRNWLKLAPKINKRGGAYQVILEWLLSGPRGWEQDIYSDEAINHAPGSGANAI
jgi:hypothetical protein